MNVYVLMALAIVSNISTIFFMKMSDGLTLPWPTLAAAVTNMFIPWFLGRAFATGANVGPTVTVLLVGVMVGSFVIGLVYGEKITTLQGLGAALAIAGLVIGNLKVA